MSYEDKLQEGEEFQDYVSDLLHDRGISIGLYTSRKYQIEKGESRSGFEIKYDKQLETTGNLFIEVQERHDPTGKYVPSGILRKDNTLFYVIGNHKRVMVFGKYQLIDLIRAKKFKLVENKEKTGVGYLLPVVRKKQEQQWVLDEHPSYILAEWRNGKIYEKACQQDLPDTLCGKRQYLRCV